MKFIKYISLCVVLLLVACGQEVKETSKSSTETHKQEDNVNKKKESKQEIVQQPKQEPSTESQSVNQESDQAPVQEPSTTESKTEEVKQEVKDNTTEQPAERHDGSTDKKQVNDVNIAIEMVRSNHMERLTKENPNYEVILVAGNDEEDASGPYFKVKAMDKNTKYLIQTFKVYKQTGMLVGE
ncbi:hypothetical protein LAU42_10865 [Macrococcus armenti]|uniref:hypothetical protein n=1 Tax=Macrococcus armenti TaxID=2875764 RepID=UPI001CCED53C|nr:hypothetical protein [Macrococcus armenti]UBH15221.1 hypothetical protein LAU44_10925 [Macrococcus armenti]UBH17580.1 hypothetical protein LAU39_10965 [Macrococcus armenti]UBH19846.1 hypothetical protein LAU40_10960 [Macrococcus armenti]UBH22213.1 hypothetical protein LAU42_10865 [Macrococcus armenti]